jgi:hypothetical protein
MNFNQLDNWIKYINAGDFDNLVSMYSGEALLFATFDRQPLDTPSLIQGYFRSFFAKEGPGVELNSSSVRHTELGESTYSSTGLYTFFFQDDGQLIRHAARFTFIFNQDNSGPILHHHSSLIPA